MTREGAGDLDRPARGEAGSERREVFYSGRVQGVGFRYTARSIATGLPVVGTVRNLPDGRVHLVAEGAPGVLDALLGRIDGEMGRFIRGKQVTAGPATGEFSSFDVVR
ncbi:MAG TPA: acylphosphatase [Pirellulales bacterium]|nr:acylphosphatase [Pirellulales bacterium]